MKITYRFGKKSKPIIMFSNERTIESIAIDIAKQLTDRTMKAKNGTIKTEIAAKRYFLGEKYLIIAALESMR